MGAPFRGLSEVAEGEWWPLTTAGASFEPAWGPASDRIYFLSDRSGSRNLWMQRVDAAARKLVGDAQLIQRFRNSKLTPLSYSDLATRYIGLTISRNQALLTLSELGGDIELLLAQ